MGVHYDGKRDRYVVRWRDGDRRRCRRFRTEREATDFEARLELRPRGRPPVELADLGTSLRDSRRLR